MKKTSPLLLSLAGILTFNLWLGQNSTTVPQTTALSLYSTAPSTAQAPATTPSVTVTPASATTPSSTVGQVCIGNSCNYSGSDFSKIILETSCSDGDVEKAVNTLSSLLVLADAGEKDRKAHWKKHFPKTEKTIMDFLSSLDVEELLEEHSEERACFNKISEIIEKAVGYGFNKKELKGIIKFITDQKEDIKVLRKERRILERKGKFLDIIEESKKEMNEEMEDLFSEYKKSFESLLKSRKERSDVENIERFKSKIKEAKNSFNEIYRETYRKLENLQPQLNDYHFINSQKEIFEGFTYQYIVNSLTKVEKVIYDCSSPYSSQRNCQESVNIMSEILGDPSYSFKSDIPEVNADEDHRQKPSSMRPDMSEDERRKKSDPIKIPHFNTGKTYNSPRSQNRRR